MAANALRPPPRPRGFMGAGKTTLGREARASGSAARSSTPTREIERQAGVTIEELFARDGEAGVPRARRRPSPRRPSVPRSRPWSRSAAAPSSPSRRREALRDTRFTVLLEVDVGVAWQRRARRGGRPLANDEDAFHALYGERPPLYEEAADARAHDADGRRARRGGDPRRGPARSICSRSSSRGAARVALVADAHVAGIQGAVAQLALGERTRARHELPPGEEAKSVAVLERLWRALRIGATTRSSPSAAAARPTSPASPRRRTCAASPGWRSRRRSSARSTRHRRQDGRQPPVRQEPRRRLPLARARRRRPGLLESLPEPSSGTGMAEVVKTGLLMGEAVWELRTRSASAAAPPTRPASACRPVRPGRAQRSSTSGTRSGTRSRRRRVRSPARARRSRSGCSRRRSSRERRRRARRSSGAARPAARARRPRARLGGARAGQEDARGDAAARPPRRAAASRRGATSSRRRTSVRRSTA